MRAFQKISENVVGKTIYRSFFKHTVANAFKEATNALKDETSKLYKMAKVISESESWKDIAAKQLSENFNMNDYENTYSNLVLIYNDFFDKGVHLYKGVDKYNNKRLCCNPTEVKAQYPKFVKTNSQNKEFVSLYDTNDINLKNINFKLYMILNYGDKLYEAFFDKNKNKNK